MSGTQKKAADGKLEPVPLDPANKSKCSYCGKKVTYDQFMANHTFGKCLTEAELPNE